MSGNRKLSANIVAVMGASGSGKTTKVMNELKKNKPARLIIWDKKGEFASEGYGQSVTSLKEVVAIVKKAGKRGFKIAYQPQDKANLKALAKQFDLLCLIAFEAKNLTFIAEELSDVTKASAAPDGWRQLTSQGRTEGIRIYGLSQNPAQIDKAFFGNCTRVWTGRLNFEAHIKSMANFLSCSVDEIRDLPKFHYIERDMDAGTISRGVVSN